MRIRVRQTKAGLLLALGLTLAMAGAALAYTPPTYGPADLNALVTRNGAGQRVVQLLFEPSNGVTYQVYKHQYGDGRKFNAVGAPLTFNAASPPAQGTGGWNYDSVYGYVYYEDGAVTDYAEYYYFVRAGTDPSWTTPPLKDYVVARAFPPTQTRHGEFSEYTYACTGCHGLHSSRTRLPGLGKLLRAPTQTDLCGTCHDGSASKYDEVLGRVRTGATWATYVSNPGGPFGTQLKDEAGAPCSFTTCGPGQPRLTAVHNVWRYGLAANGSVAATAAQFWQAPGSTYLSASQPDPSTTWTKPLTCVGCHEPHNKFKNYRLLRGDFDLQNYNLPDNTGSRRVNVVVRGVSEVNLAVSGSVYQMATRYLDGSNQSGGAITDFCSGCHRFFTGPYNELDPNDTGTDNTVYDNVYTHGWKRHRMGMPAKLALSTSRIIDPGLTGDGLDAVQNRLVDWDGTNLSDYQDVTRTVYAYVPLEGTNEDDPGTTANEYAENKVVCLTCHVPHGTAKAAGGFAPAGDTVATDGKLQLEVAYWNNKLNFTDSLASDSVESYVYDRNIGKQFGRISFTYGGDTIPGYLHNRLTGPNGESGVIYGWSGVLARFEPFASACWRCHSTR